MLSAVVLTKNEENNIVDCLESLSSCDEIIVVDDTSEDRTVDVAENKGAKVFTHSLNGDFSQQRNFGLEKAKGDWILFVDADERVPKELRDEIAHLIKLRGRENRLNGYFVKRQDILWGKRLKYGETASTKLVRLARRNTGRWEGRVHERWVIGGMTGILKGELLHYPHQTLKEFLQEINCYSDLRAQELSEMKTKSSFLSIILYPKAKFLLNYFWRRGFLDGTGGFVHAMLMSFHSFLVRGKLWLLWHKK